MSPVYSVNDVSGCTGSLTVDRIDFERVYTDRVPITLSVHAEGIRFFAALSAQIRC